jgi:hypothetical protein
LGSAGSKFVLTRDLVNEPSGSVEVFRDQLKTHELCKDHPHRVTVHRIESTELSLCGNTWKYSSMPSRPHLEVEFNGQFQFPTALIRSKGRPVKR